MRPAELEVLAQLAGRTWTAEELPGGLSNATYRARTTDAAEPLDLVVRSWREARPLVPIDRDVERRATAAAAAAGVGPRVAAYEPGDCLIVTEYVEGRPLIREDLANAEVRRRVAGTLRTLHAGPPLGVAYDLFGMIRRYAEIAAERGTTPPPGWSAQRGAVDRVEAALAARPEPLVPAHNDLVPANMIDTGERIVLIDFEYAGDNEPSCELAILAAGAVLAGVPGLEDAEVTDLVAAYGAPATLARVRLWRAVVDHGWALWAELVGGYPGMATELTDRAGRTLAASVLDPLIEEVSR